MGCNTSQEAAQKVEEEAKQLKEDIKKLEGNHVTEIKEQLTEILDSGTAEEEKAATKIQAVFRGHQSRKTTQGDGTEGTENTMSSSAQNAEPEPTKAELEAEFNPADKELCHAATKIQASFRGHQVRKQAEQATAKEVDELSAKAEELDIDLTDPSLTKRQQRSKLLSAVTRFARIRTNKSIH